MPSASKTRRLAGLKRVVLEGDKGRLCFRGVLLVRNCSNGRSCSGMRRRVSIMVDGEECVYKGIQDEDRDQRTADITFASRLNLRDNKNY